MYKDQRCIKQYPATSEQKQFWLINRMQPQNTAYNICETFLADGPLNVLVLEKSINCIIARNSIFRTYFTLEQEGLIQNISDELLLKIKYEDLRKARKAEGVKCTDPFIQEAKKRPFDLAVGPLIRVQVLRLKKLEYMIIIVIHHIIFDLETKILFAKELSIIYEALSKNEQPNINSTVRQYFEYAVWQELWKKSDERKQISNYWKQQLEGTSGLLQFPYDHKRPNIQSLRGSAYPIKFNQKLYENLEYYCKQNMTSIYLVMLAAYIALIYRYTGQKDIVIGIPLTNRRQENHKTMMGCFINTIPLAIFINDNISFKQLLNQIRKAMLGAHRNQKIPFEAILQDVQPIRKSGYNPLYQVGFTFESPMPLKLKGIKAKPVWVHSGGAQLDLFAVFWHHNGSLNGYFEYDVDIFKKWKIKNFAQNYEKTLTSVIENSQNAICSIPIISDIEKEELFRTLNETNVVFDASDGIHMLFEKQAKKTPKCVSVKYEEKTLTYQELDSKSNQLANYLVELGVGPDALVGIYMDRCIDMLVALLGVLKAGGAYVPLDPDFPIQRITYMIDHSKPTVILTQEILHDDLPVCDAHKICLEKKWDKIAQYSNKGLGIKIDPQNLAYVMYTSGSTGMPKGVQIPHEALVNFMGSMAREPGIDPKDVLLAVTTLSFDISVLELFLPLLVGAKVVIANRTVATDGVLLSEMIKKEKITFMQATPTTWRLLFSAGWSMDRSFKVLCGGEPLPKDLANDLIQKAGGVWNMYGPTETTIWSTCYHLTDVDQKILIGKPIANTRIYLLDKQMNPVPLGVQGELYIGGAGLARGYLNQPKLTMERFIKDPFCDETDARMYKTGDWCRYLEDGNIEFYNRIDHQVKVHGFRIELGEIENALNHHPAVQEAAAAVLDGNNGNKRLIGYIVPINRAPSIETLRDYLQEKLPYYMVPSIYVALEKMPLTPNAKIDRKALPEPDISRPDLDEAYVAPANEHEKKMAEIWRSALNIERIGIHDNFFVLGGDSLLVVRTVTKIQEEFSIDIRAAKLFQYPTISSLVAFLLRNEKMQDAKIEQKNRAQLRRLSYLGRKQRILASEA